MSAGKTFPFSISTAILCFGALVMPNFVFAAGADQHPDALSVANAGWTETVIHSFAGTDGYPASGLISDASGNLYGTTFTDLTNREPGLVFELLPNANGQWTERTLWQFCSRTNCEDGEFPEGGLVFDHAGNLYGTTVNGGTSRWCQDSYGCGVIFQLTKGADGNWSEKVLYNFCSHYNCNDGFSPSSSLVFDSSGNLYGTAGVVAFELSPGKTKWSYKVLSGGLGVSSLVFDARGNLYGFSWNGSCCGSVSRLSPGANGNWTGTDIHKFDGWDGSLSGPQGGLILDPAGNLYGVTSAGGTTYGSSCSGYGCGVVFELLRTQNDGWTEKVLHNFHDNGSDGTTPFASLILDRAGKLYGTTFAGGTSDTCGGGYGDGTVFQLTPDPDGHWSESILHYLGQGDDGCLPTGNLMLGSSGNLYGTTELGGAYGGGTVFGMTP